MNKLFLNGDFKILRQLLCMQYCMGLGLFGQPMADEGNIRLLYMIIIFATVFVEANGAEIIHFTFNLPCAACFNTFA